VRALVAEEVQRAKMALPIAVNYDPHNEGYRRTSDSVLQRNLMPVQQARMFEIAYYMFDASAMFRRLGVMDRGFLFSGPIKIDSRDDDVQGVIDRFWEDEGNALATKFPEKCMWLSFLGEQCWPVTINPHNGLVRLQYLDPALIKDVWVNPLNVEQAMRVDMMDLDQRTGHKYSVIRKDWNAYSKTYNRLVGDCFFFAINHPPNAPRGRSDYLTLFDWIDAWERYAYNYLERAEFMMNFVWDVLLKGMSEEQIREWLRSNPPPEPGSIRAHNESVEWAAVAPDIKAQDFRQGFDMGKEFIMGASGRPSSWFGAGGKSYQTEAEQFGQVPIADLEQRQGYLMEILRKLIQFQVDQAVIAGYLPEEKAAAGFNISMPEVSKKDLAKMVNGIPQVTTALAVAVSNKLITRDTATRIFGFVASYLGYEVDAQAEIDAVLAATADDEQDYDKLLDSRLRGNDKEGRGNDKEGGNDNVGE
ncbi:MAG: hypothetical protein U1D99_08015, partial [Candidatus Omnitrophota bacterium]|nr:hypothetical protein [Candidatus Omnitrophota bacterium]